MTDTNISDAIVFPEDEGTGVVDEKADRASAGHAGLLAQHIQGSYVDKGCAFANVDTTNEQVDITAGHTFIELESVSIQSGSQATYDTTLPNPIVLCVVLPTDIVDLGLDADATNDIWLAVDATTNDGAYLRHGSGLSAPADPSVKLGTVDTASGSTTRANDGAAVTVRSLGTDEASVKDRLREPAIVSIPQIESSAVGPHFVEQDWHETPDRLWSPSADTYSDDHGDTSTSTGDSVPTNADKLISAANGYLYAITESPLELWRASYSTGGFSWTRVFSGRTSSAYLDNAGRYSTFGVSTHRGTLIMGEYGSPSNGPKLFRSTDSGASWVEVAQFGTKKHVHSVSQDPYVEDQWFAVLGDSGDKRFARSTDDGQTWTREAFGPESTSQSVGIDFSADRIFFAEDRGAYAHGPWFYHRETGQTGLLCSEHPKQTFDQYAKDPLQYAIIHDADTGVTYWDQQDPGRPYGHLIGYTRWIGDKPQLIATGAQVGAARLTASSQYIFNGSNRVARLKVGGVE